jgi:dUTP pyrophosphatase
MPHILKIALLDNYKNDADLINFYTNPKNYSSDSGVNLCFPEDVVIPKTWGPGKLVGLGVKCELDYDGGYYLFPRSSIYKTSVCLANSVGVIDNGYRGEIKAALKADLQWEFKKGESIVQIVAPDAKRIIVQLVQLDELSNTERGDNGLGSTGK